MANHAPGPWIAATYSKKRFGLGAKPRNGLSTPFMYLQCAHYTTADPMAIADARLIRAAPCLLAALKKLLKGSNPKSIEAARAAIARATTTP